MDYRRKFAKELRKQMTDAERLLWRHLRAHRMNGEKFRRQQPIGLILPSTDGHPVKRVNYATEVNHGKTDNPQESIPCTVL